LQQAYPAFTDFPDSVSNTNGDPTMCPKTYTATVSTNAGGKSLTSLTLDSSLRQFTISSQSYDQIGSYTVTITAAVIGFTSVTKTATLTVTVKDPCLQTTLTPPSLLPANMNTSVLVQTAGGTPLFVSQTVAPFFDTVSSAPRGNGTDVCGARTFTFSTTVFAASASSALNSSELKYNTNTGVVSVWTARNAVIGTHTVTVTAKLS
jgi:hypothetical protein